MIKEMIIMDIMEKYENAEDRVFIITMKNGNTFMTNHIYEVGDENTAIKFIGLRILEYRTIDKNTIPSRFVIQSIDMDVIESLPLDLSSSMLSECNITTNEWLKIFKG